MGSHGGRGRRHSSRQSKEKRRGRQLRKQQAIKHRENNKRQENKTMSDSSKRNNPAEFVRAVLCAMLISMLFSFVMAHVGDAIVGNDPLWNCKHVCALVQSGKVGHLLFAALWMLFYFGYLVDDYIHEKPDNGKKEHIGGLALAWIFLFGQVCAVWYPMASAALGFVGLLALSWVLCSEKKPLWGTHVFENICIMVTMLFYLTKCLHFSCVAIICMVVLVCSKLRAWFG